MSFLGRSTPLILDGALGTELEARGKPIGTTKLWSAQVLADDPEIIRAIHLDYLRAGADIITTASYQASLPGFAAEGIGAEEAGRLLRLAVQVAVQARDEFWEEHTTAPPPQQQQRQQRQRQRPLVALSCGSYGAFLADGSEFTGDYQTTVSEQDLQAFHRGRLEAVLEEPDIDLVVFETTPCLKEALAVARLLQEGRYSWPAAVSFSCKDGQHTCAGDSLAGECVPALLAFPQVVAIGINCTAPLHILPLLKGASEALAQARAQATAAQTSAPVLMCYPNSGETWDGEGRCWHPAPGVDGAGPKAFAQTAQRWVGEGGASVVGGCCRTGPEHIRCLREALLGGGTK